MSYKSMMARLEYDGGNKMGRINKQKLRSFQAALKNDYNSRQIKTPNGGVWNCLVNTYLLKPDYDRQILSVEFNSELQAGDTFEVLDDGSHWMVYLPDLVETAYLKSEIIKCRYQLEIDGEKYWIYFRGPTETDISWYKQKDIEFNKLNYSGTIYIKNTPITKKLFQRFTVFEIDGHNWQVEVADPISVPGILELEIQEYYDSVAEKLPKIYSVEETITGEIIGATIVKQNSVIGYMIDKSKCKEHYNWSIKNNNRVRIKSISDDKHMVEVQILPGAIKNFVIAYGPYELQININTAYEVINGPEIVYPYEIYEYNALPEEDVNDQGEIIQPYFNQCDFILDSALAKIISIDQNKCKIEILSGKSGNFNLICLADNQEYSKKIQIKSL